MAATVSNLEDEFVEEHPVIEFLDHLLNYSLYWSVFVMILTAWALFADDIKKICLPKEVDAGFLAVNWAILAVFLLEFVLSAVVKPVYLFSLQAFMDLLAALSLIPFDDAVGDRIEVARIARAARALRILRATRAAALALKAEARVKKMKRKASLKQQLWDEEETSVLEDALCLRTNTKMLLGILVLLMGTSLITESETDGGFQSGLNILDAIYTNSYLPSPSAVTGGDVAWEKVWHDYRDQIEDGTRRELMFLEVNAVTYYSQDYSSFRTDELKEYSTQDSKVIVSYKEQNDVNTGFSMALTVFAVIVIVTWTQSFQGDHKTLVINPVNRMIFLLKSLSKDPRLAIQGIDHNVVLKKKEQMTELEQIEVCVKQFGQLLKVGFGEAGLSIVKNNFKTRSFDPVIKGLEVDAIFGFCDIRNFTDSCEVLNEDTMGFTNKIAYIVHGLVEESGGSVNKNIGDAFLTVWKLKKTEGDNPGFVHHLSGSAEVIDNTLKSFIQMSATLKSDADIQELCKDERLQKKLPGYTVRMGYGLHLGSAIEGAVGSQYKVDATYLGPNVNMASWLEGATKTYGVTILMTNAIVDHMSDSMKKECRAIDHVTVKGYKKPIMLYCHFPSESVDLDDAQREEFMRIWENAFETYQCGMWPQSKKQIEACLKIFENDRPSKVLLDVMEECNGKAPPSWPGYRDCD